MKAHFTRCVRAAVCATVLLLAPSAAQAAMLLPGQTVVLTPADILADPVAIGDVEASTTLGFANIFYTGSLTAAVVRNAGGTLDFYYQITNNAGSAHSLARSTDAVFTGFTTEVFYRIDDAGLPGLFSAGAAGATPITVDRPIAPVVGFGFLPPATFPPTPVAGEPIDPGETSMILVIRTNATSFISGFSAVSNGLTENLVTFAPAVVPEPASLLLLSSAFGAAGYLARHRARRRKPGSA